MGAAFLGHPSALTGRTPLRGKATIGPKTSHLHQDEREHETRAGARAPSRHPARWRAPAQAPLTEWHWTMTRMQRGRTNAAGLAPGGVLLLAPRAPRFDLVAHPG